jgi:hypothetical protein
VTDPRGSFRRLQGLDLARTDLWLALGAVTAASVVLFEISLRINASLGGEPPMLVFLMDPFTTAFIEFSLLVGLAFAINWGGQVLGGIGRFPDALLSVTWLQFVLACLQVVQTAVLLVAPVIAGLIGLFGAGLAIWLLASFVAEMHGFQSRGRVLAALVIGFLGLSLLLTLILAFLGVGFSGGCDV